MGRPGSGMRSDVIHERTPTQTQTRTATHASVETVAKPGKRCGEMESEQVVRWERETTRSDQRGLCLAVWAQSGFSRALIRAVAGHARRRPRETSAERGGFRGFLLSHPIFPSRAERHGPKAKTVPSVRRVEFPTRPIPAAPPGWRGFWPSRRASTRGGRTGSRARPTGRPIATAARRQHGRGEH